MKKGKYLIVSPEMEEPLLGSHGIAGKPRVRDGNCEFDLVPLVPRGIVHSPHVIGSCVEWEVDFLAGRLGPAWVALVLARCWMQKVAVDFAPHDIVGMPAVRDAVCGA